MSELNYGQSILAALWMESKQFKTDHVRNAEQLKRGPYDPPRRAERNQV